MISNRIVSRIQRQIGITTSCDESIFSENFSRFYVSQTEVSGIWRMTGYCAILESKCMLYFLNGYEFSNQPRGWYTPIIVDSIGFF